MFRLIRFLIITLTLGRIKWLMRLTWVWRLIVFLGLTGWLSKKLRGMIGFDKRAATDVDSAWADALRYTPAPAGASPAAASAPLAAKPAPAPVSEPLEEATDEVIGYAADGSSETITMHEVRAGDEFETMVRIEDEAGNVETLVTDSPVEELDLANLGEPATETVEQAVEQLDLELIDEAEIDEIIDTLEAAEPKEEEIAPEAPKRRRTRKPKPAPETSLAEPLETASAEPIIDPDWVRGDGTDECPETHPVKAKASSMIYYVPESGHYGLTIPDVCFASDLDAEAAGYRAPRR